MSNEPQVKWTMEEGISCSEGGVGCYGRAMLQEVGSWEGNGWFHEGLKVVDDCLGISVIGLGVDGGLEVFNPGNPGGPVHTWEKFRFEPFPSWCGSWFVS